MELTGFSGNKLTAIECAVINVNVIVLNDEKAQIMGRAAMAIELNKRNLTYVPSNCPLTRHIEDRTVESFTACKTCPNATLVS